MNVKTILGVVMLSALVGAAAASLITFNLINSKKPTQNDLIRDFYLTENAVHVSPHSVRKRMDNAETNFVLVDVRSPIEYEKEHIIGAINIPAYKDPNTSISLDSEKEEKDRIINSFKELGQDKEIIVYCYSMPCMTGRKIGKLLTENDIYVKSLGIGWNEWRYYWTLWNHDAETPTKFEDYVWAGKEPGIPKKSNVFSPCKTGELGC
jgi:rhodanese-related sulfurtransferase